MTLLASLAIGLWGAYLVVLGVAKAKHAAEATLDAHAGDLRDRAWGRTGATPTAAEIVDGDAGDGGEAGPARRA